MDTVSLHLGTRAGATGERTVSSVCCYCGTGCGVRVTAQDARVLRVEGDPDHPANRGKLCSKGLMLADTVRRDEARVLRAQWRPERGRERSPVPLSDALDLAAGKLATAIQLYGPDSVGFYLSGQLLTEDYAVFNKLARALVGTNNIDTNSRLCMSSAVSGYKLTLGADAPPACYDDLELADTVLIAGSNMAYAHPVLFRRLEVAKAARPEMKIIVIDPRRTDTTALADLHLPIVPGTDVALFHAMLNVMVWDGLIDAAYIAAHTAGFDALKSRVQEFTPRAAQDVCGVPAADIALAARWFGQAGAALSLYTMGLNQSSSGTAKNGALINLHLATGQIGRPGAGPFSLTGQPNAMGGREAGGMATLLPGHRDPGISAHRQEVAALWGVDQLPETAGKPALEMFDAVLDGQIKVLWIAATNPAQSLPDQAKVRAALQRAEFVIVQEAYAGTETLAYADLVLPAATWPEKSGTLTNSERRISRVRSAVPPPGDARPDWQLAVGVAQRLARLIAPGKGALFDYADESAVFAEHARTTAGRDLDYSAVDYALLDRTGPVQWPYRDGVSTARLYTDGQFATADGRARFYDTGYMPVAEAVSAPFPLRLTTGRLRDHWHTMTRTGLSAALTRHVEEPWLSLHPIDLERAKLQAGSLARVKSRRGSMVLPVRADDALRPGHVFLPMHWGSAFMAGLGVNALTNPARDPVSRQPELKHAAVAIAPAHLPWQVMGWLAGDPSVLRAQLAPWLRRFDYAVVLPCAVGPGVRLRLAADSPPPDHVLDALAQALGLEKPDAAFDDPSRGVLRRVRLQDGLPTAFLLAGDVRAHDGLLAWAEGGAAPASVAMLLMGRNQAVPRSRTVCACVGVTEQEILAGTQSGLDAEGLTAKLGCGTGCGSCMPEVRRLAALHTA
ncbi:molybdopterin-dependent oxidoreductase [Bordetella tumulicola]|uniref:nitrate reductase n=1 Tax=Bordetella tumulicola TaxID=1649133 RepID=UPI0039EFA7D7